MGTIFHGSYASATSASCLGVRNSPTRLCSKEGKRWRPEPKPQTEQNNAGEFQEFSYVSPQQRRGNISKGTTALSFSTQAVAIISVIHLSGHNLLSSKTDCLPFTSSHFKLIQLCAFWERRSQQQGFSQRNAIRQLKPAASLACWEKRRQSRWGLQQMPQEFC